LWIDATSLWVVKDFLIVRAQWLDGVLVSVRVDRFFERLAQQVLAAFRGRDVAIGAQHDVVGSERIGGDKEAQVALDQAALIFRQTVRVFPQRDVALHVHFLRHRVIGAAASYVRQGKRSAQKNPGAAGPRFFEKYANRLTPSSALHPSGTR
jgi:hypothetical protein